ncbi:hypothetical protein PIB30_024703 [Stylosanthes scabra]|uniref:Uncharacterized protein n=1 Tax=Stylosanthes scabra TaxID=79078 RepID=A0ABU6QAI2_9FABA|nr:hypothetical protein [Stylosanthes scabra]
MSEEMVQRRPLANPSPALQERKSKKRQEPIDSGVQRNDESNIPPTNIIQQGTGALGKKNNQRGLQRPKEELDLLVLRLNNGFNNNHKLTLNLRGPPRDA